MILLYVALGIVMAGFLVALFIAFLPSGALGALEKKLSQKPPAPPQTPGEGEPPGG